MNIPISQREISSLTWPLNDRPPEQESFFTRLLPEKEIVLPILYVPVFFLLMEGKGVYPYSYVSVRNWPGFFYFFQMECSIYFAVVLAGSLANVQATWPEVSSSDRCCYLFSTKFFASYVVGPVLATVDIHSKYTASTYKNPATNFFRHLPVMLECCGVGLWRIAS